MENTKVFSIFGVNGMEELKQRPFLPHGCIIYAYGYGMSQTMGCIISEPDQYDRQRCVSLGKYEPHFFYADKHSQPLSKKFGIGVYFVDNLEIVDNEEIQAAILRAEVATAEGVRKDEEKKKQNAEEVQKLPSLFPYLIPVNKDGGRSKQVMDNIRRSLKHNFPGTKFSVTNPHGSSCEIRWNDGATHDEVDKVVSMFKDHHSDITGDFSDYSPSNFNHVFGGMQYVFPTRSMSKEVENVLYPLMEKLFNEHSKDRGEVFNCRSFENLAYRLFAQNSIPHGAIITGIEETGETCGLNDVNTFYRLSFTLPEKNEPEEGKAANIEGVKVVEYSEKAVAVYGNTKPIKDQLKAIGARFNMFLTIEGIKQPGWVLPISQRSKLYFLSV